MNDKANYKALQLHGGDIYKNKVELDFSVNINHLGMPCNVRRALHEAVAHCEEYPDHACAELISVLSSRLGISPDRLILGNGASELFWAIVHALKPARVMIPVPSFSGYKQASECEYCDVEYYYLREEDGFALTEKFLGAISDDLDMIFLANPNNPTGRCVEQALMQRIARLCQEKRIWLVIDESFIEFTKRESESLAADGLSRLITVRAFTKSYAIPGVRLGYMISSREVCSLIRKQLPDWNISIFAQRAGAAAVSDEKYLNSSVELIQREREALSRDLRSLGLKIYEGEANYLLFYLPDELYEGQLYKLLLERGILIRCCESFVGLGKGYYRTAIRSRDDNLILIEEIKKALMKI